MKNIKLLNGIPLIAYTIKAALDAKVDRIIVSTDSEEIAEVAVHYGSEVIIRPDTLALDDSPTLPVIQHVLKEVHDQYQPDVILTLQPTSPFRKSWHISDALTVFSESNSDSLVSVVKVPHSFNPFSVMSLSQNGYLVPYQEYNENENMRQLKPTFYARNGAAIYICTYDCLIKKNSLYGDKIIPYEMSQSESIDIDDEWDWTLAELILNLNC